MTEAVAADAPAPGVFSRKASGLVRVGSTLDVFIFNVGLVSVGIAIAYNQYFGPSLYPGAQPWISTLLAALGMIFIAAAFYCWTVVFPRSGGVYVFLSRTINPGVAFGAIVFMWLIAFQAVAFLTFIEVLLVVWGMVMVSAVIFPVRRRKLYESSPARNFKVFGVPIMPVAGAVSAVFSVVMIWLLWMDPIAAGPLLKPSKMPVEFWVTVAAILVGAAWYIWVKAYRKRRGINISLAFQQIPIE